MTLARDIQKREAGNRPGGTNAWGATCEVRLSG